MAPRRSRSGGARKLPARYEARPPADEVTRVLLDDAVRAHRRGRIDEAITGYRRVIDRMPDALDALVNLGNAEARAGRARRAAAAFARVVALEPSDARALRDVGFGLVAIGHHAEARPVLARAVALAPDLVGARLALTRVAAWLGDREAALSCAEETVRRAPNDASAHVELCLARFDDRDPMASRAAADRAVALDPGFVWARYVRAIVEAWSGRTHDDDLPPHLADAIAAALAVRETTTRAFATKPATLHHALAVATDRGSVVELGVRHGASSRVLAAHVGELHGFDGFDGLPEAWDDREAGVFATAGEPPDLPPCVRLHVGPFARTLPPFVASDERPIRLLHVDSDLYESARFALDVFAPRIRPGTIMAFDELFGNRTWRDDEHRALVESAARFGWSLRFEAISLLTGQAVVRIA